jgi:hypothetical protein
MVERTEKEKLKELLKYSDPELAQKNAIKYLGKDALLYLSSRKNKKYMIRDKNNNKWVHFGTLDPPYEDFTKHHNEARRQHFLKRTSSIRGNWRENPYSPNNLSRILLWGG